jgi:hypothetical protein
MPLLPAVTATTQVRSERAPGATARTRAGLLEGLALNRRRGKTISGEYRRVRCSG